LIGLEHLRQKFELADYDEISRAAIVLAGVAAYELSRDASPRSLLIPKLFRGHEVSLEGGALLSPTEIGLPADVEDFFVDWLRGRRNLFDLAGAPTES
jgi:hypothetical protein